MVHSPVSKVVEELKDGADELADRVKDMPETFALDVVAETAPRLARLSQWAATQPNYVAAARAEFLSVADYYLVAQAHAHGYTVATHEQPRADSKRRIFIPDACGGMPVPWMDPWRMLRDEGAEFLLASD